MKAFKASDAAELAMVNLRNDAVPENDADLRVELRWRSI